MELVSIQVSGGPVGIAEHLPNQTALPDRPVLKPPQW
jgi:hypothetical protein